MRIIVIGATGTVGRAVADACATRGHEVIRISRSSDPRVDIEDQNTIQALFDKISGIEAVVSCAGHGKWGPLATLTDDDLAISIRNKLMGQINLIRIAVNKLKEGGSITVTSGMLGIRPVPGSAAISLANGGLDAFVRAAALEAPRKIRINVVSPYWVSETLRARGMDESPGVPADEVAKAYVSVVEGKMNGEVLEVSK